MTARRPIAAIDIGTNSIHMVVARQLDGGTPEILVREKESIRLGRGATDMKQLTPDAVDRAIDTLARFRRIADALDADVVAVATSAVREAENQSEFLRRARHDAGVVVDVVSGVEEARLIHLGVLGAVPTDGRRHLVIDIGGGSTEFVVADGTVRLLVRSLKLGHIRLTDRFFPDGIVGPTAVADCRRHVRAFVAPVAREILATGFEVAIGCSGTIENLARMAMLDRGIEPRTMDNQVLRRTDLDRTVERVLAAETMRERRSLFGLDPQRADVITAGAILLRQLCRSLGVEEMVISGDALREGVVLDQFARRTASGDALHHLTDIRRSSVLGMARRYEDDIAHVQHATDLALEMFDALRPVHGYGEPERDLLEAGGILHNVGRFIAHAAHHKHSYYLIRHSEHLAGFTEQETELIAQVARYHRKSSPRNKHAEFAALDPDDQQRVRVLAGLLRIAIALDRTYRRSVERVTASLDHDLTIFLTTATDADVELELFTARERAGLLSLALGTTIEFVVDEAPPDHASTS